MTLPRVRAAAFVASLGAGLAGCGSASTMPVDAGAEASVEVAPFVPTCNTTPATQWAPDWSTTVTTQDIGKGSVAVNSAGDRVAVATSWNIGGNLAVDELDRGGGRLWTAPLGALARGGIAIVVAADGAVFAAAPKIETANGLLGTADGDQDASSDLDGGAEAGRSVKAGLGPLFKLDADGQLAWATSLVDGDKQPAGLSYNGGLRYVALAIDVDGGLWVAETTFVPPQDPTPNAEIDGLEIVLEKHDPADGHLLFSRSFFTKSVHPLFPPDPTVFLAASPSGGIVLAGGLTTSIDLGGGVLMGPMTENGENLLVARFDADGSHRWSATFGGRYFSRPGGLIVDAEGAAIVSGVFDGLLQFGDTLLGAHGQDDGFVAKLTPDGKPQWAASVGDEASNAMGAVGVDPSGRVRVKVYNVALTLPDGSGLAADATGAVLSFDAGGTLRAARCLPYPVANPTAFDATGDDFIWVPVDPTRHTGVVIQRLPPF